MTPQAFFSLYGNSFVIASMGTSIFPSVKAAQAALETGYGKAIIGNNMFGIKAQGAHSPYWTGDVVNFATHEVRNGVSVPENDDFRAYKNVSDSISDHTYFLKQNKRYAGVFQAATPEAQCQALQAAGYATSPTYAKTLISIITANNLKDLDKKKR